MIKHSDHLFHSQARAGAGDPGEGVGSAVGLPAAMGPGREPGVGGSRLQAGIASDGICWAGKASLFPAVSL